MTAKGLELRVGRGRFTVPPGSQLAHVTRRLCWVLSPAGSVSAYTKNGRLDLPDNLQILVRSQVFGLADAQVT